MRHTACCGVVLVALLFGAHSPLAAQVAAPEPTRAAVFQRAQRLVNDGLGAEGRALVDSLLNVTAPRSPEEAEVLHWRATLAESWDQAQRDYLRVMLEHERSAFAATAMLRLAQGELMRGDREAAMRYAERLLREAPEAPERADAQALRERLLAEGVPSSIPAPVPVAPAPAAPTAPANTPVTTPSPARPATPAPAPAATGALRWSVQIAAFGTAAEAAGFAAEMRERGYEARVDGSVAPFRVRFGYYATRAQATAAMEAYKTKERGDAFLAQVPAP
jgi:cell division septation protein DedD